MRHLVVVVLGTWLTSVGAAWAQGTAPAAPPAGLVVGSGNFFSPIVASLERAVAFYRDGLGVDIQGTAASADGNLALRQMFGLPNASLRWLTGRPGAGRGGVEIVEIAKADGRPVMRRPQDPGAFTLVATVRDLDATLARLKATGTPVITGGGVPVRTTSGAAARAVVVADPDGHFVQLEQPDALPAGDAPATANVVAVRVRLAVEDLDRTVRLYRDGLGLILQGITDATADPAAAQLLGLPAAARARRAAFTVPGSGLSVEFVAWSGVDRRIIRANLQDPGSTRIQLQVRDVEASIAAVKAAGGVVQSTGGGIVELPGRGGATTKVAIVREPDNLFLVLLGVAPQRTP